MQFNKGITFATLNLLNYAAPPFSFYQPDERYEDSMWQQKQNWLKGVISKIAPDIIAFQEVFSVSELEALCQGAGLPYFAAVDTPGLSEERSSLYIRPVCAIASRYPFERITRVEIDDEITSYFNIDKETVFNRQPVRCEITLPNIGNCVIYSVHLKSQRTQGIAGLEPLLDVEQIRLITSTLGYMQSHISRSLEANLLYYDVIRTQTAHRQPCILMGDFNNRLSDPSLSVLGRHTKDIGLVDAWQLTGLEQIRKSTHYYAGIGSVLDYILLSPSLIKTAGNGTALAYGCVDEHLNPEGGEDLSSSDHAAVWCRF